MKILSLYYDEERVKHPKEDAWAIDSTSSIFAVADGVSLKKSIEFKDEYPVPSPAGEIAQEFCNKFIRYGKTNKIKESFGLANKAVFHFNKNRDKANTFSKAEAYYATTASFGIIKKNVLDWGCISDSSVSVINPSGELVLFYCDHHHHNEFDPLLGTYSTLDASYVLRTLFRNALSEKGKKLGYGVVTGERSSEPYVNYGKRKLKKGELVVFATDGFEFYLQEKSFRKALLSMDQEIIENTMNTIKAKKKNKAEYMSERTIIIVSI